MASEITKLLSKYSKLLTKFSEDQFAEWDIRTKCPKSHFLQKGHVRKLLDNDVESITVIRPISYKVKNLTTSSKEVKNISLSIDGYIIAHDNFAKWLSKHIEKMQSRLLIQNVVENDDIRRLVTKHMSDDTFKRFAITNSTVRNITRDEYVKRRFEHYRSEDIKANLPVCITYIKLGDYENFVKNYSPDHKNQIGVYAIEYNRVNVLEFLFKNATNIRGYDITQKAVMLGHIHMLELIKENIKKLQSDYWDSSLLNRAFEKNHMHVFIWLIENTDIKPENSILEILCEKGHLEILKKTKDAYNYKRYGALLCASASLGGRLDVLEWLHTAQKCQWDDEVYINAITNNHANIVKYALENECPIERPRLLVRIANNSSSITIKALVNRYVQLPAFTYLSVFHDLNNADESHSQSSNSNSQSSNSNSHHRNTVSYVTKEMNKINGKFIYINEGDIVLTYATHESRPEYSVYCVRIINGVKELGDVNSEDYGIHGYISVADYISYAEGEFPTTDFRQVTIDLKEHFWME